MELHLTPEEWDAVEFALRADLETVETTIEHEGGNPDLALEAMHLRRVLAKMDQIMEDVHNGRE